MGFVNRMVDELAAGGSRTGALELPGHAAGGHLGAKTAAADPRDTP